MTAFSHSTLPHTANQAILAVVLCLPGITAFAQAGAAAQEPMKCETGPLSKTYGGSTWLVYSCADARSLVVVSAPGSAATPFYFMFHAVAGGYRLIGEGNAPKAVTQKAHAELSALSEKEIVSLVEQSRSLRK